MTDRTTPQMHAVYSDGSSFPYIGTSKCATEPGHVSGQKSVNSVTQNSVQRARRGYDPHSVHRDFPARWQRYIRSNFHSLSQVQDVFAVSERTARKWWNGENGANGGHVAIAVAEHPVKAPIILFAAE